eukprot:37960-Eustigmatos_ZCMA.PRE.1
MPTTCGRLDARRAIRDEDCNLLDVVFTGLNAISSQHFNLPDVLVRFPLQEVDLLEQLLLV